jgi:hypothetical protein
MYSGVYERLNLVPKGLIVEIIPAHHRRPLLSAPSWLENARLIANNLYL